MSYGMRLTSGVAWVDDHKSSRVAVLTLSLNCPHQFICFQTPFVVFIQVVRDLQWMMEVSLRTRWNLLELRAAEIP